MVLHRDGTVFEWSDPAIFQPDTPIGLSNVVAISGGDLGAMALTADASAIIKAANPNAKIVKGYKRDIMPVFQGQINEDGLLQLVVYIKSLSPPAPRPAQTKSPGTKQNPQ